MCLAPARTMFNIYSILYTIYSFHVLYYALLVLCYKLALVTNLKEFNI